MKFISPLDLKKMMEEGRDVIILDVREPYELDICQVDALHIPMAEVPSRVDEIPASGEIIVMCRSGQRASAVANMLAEEFERGNISILDGGILGWIDQVDNTLEAY